ncbi:hypothetical protein B0F90DRAFT_1671141 [Multifurca ochricompacta]|uniref:Uncharacterized protein n=1 Tax=Multifurca ochricompacta TaxID=376703 RepID=A0AAD4LWR8_9AGAM|nr:hypothetical protein B0F90DRAFT_1671141 [Multifurca ochricompacta]
MIAIALHIQTLNQFHGQDAAAVGVIKWLKRLARILNELSTNGVLPSEDTCLPSHPVKAVLAAIGVLLVTVDATQVRPDYEMLIDLLRSIESFLKCLSTNVKIPPTMAVRDMVVMILLELLSTLALATQQAKQGRLRKLGEKLLGEHDIEAMLQRLSQGGQQGAQMAATQTLDIIHGLVQNMKALIDGDTLNSRVFV